MDNMTAKVSCFARAFHHKMNRVHIFDDTAAEALLGDDYEQIAKNMTGGIGFFLPGFEGTKEEGLRLIVDGQLSPSVLGRSAYCERMLENEIRLGCRQYLILACGYDTYAIRQAVRNTNCSAARNMGGDTARNTVRNEDTMMTVYELDRQELLDDKKNRIREAGLESGAVNVPCDLADPSWQEKLMQTGYDAGVKSFVSLLGLVYYLRKEDFKSLLKTLRGILPVGSAICMDYPMTQGGKETEMNQALAAGAGEQMQAAYSYEEMEKLLSDCGFLIYEHLDHEQMEREYFADYNEHAPLHPMKAPKGVSYLLAVRHR